MSIQVHAEAFVPGPRPRVFEYAVQAENLPRLFTGYGVIPAIRGARLVESGPLRVGSQRRVENADGSVVNEEVTGLVQGELHQYRLTGLRPPFSWLVRSGESTWRFSDEGSGTRVRWTYEFNLTRPWVWPVAALLLFGPFAQAMARCLGHLARMGDFPRV